ncbi:synaptopodin 2-like protein isoform X2 [Ctenopharyngodon idella]|uniref:synaptopodin 2-like protein isoform X2 n=1 Tax=Ctenopharyngodon idella TaxID=7959 RepID=UPI00222E87A2|nr:synaptopodin 2-like protein isoform X2 [Ctenopharyngodon idella]
MRSFTSPGEVEHERHIYAELHRGESLQDKQVKEARSKCRTIASLLTDAPNPHSKGVLMFKKRRQRAKKYTLTCFGSVDGESYSNTEGETEDESLFPGSESELDEDGFSAAPDPTWDSGYLDVLDKRTSACIVPDSDAEISPGLNATSGKGAQLFEQQRKRAEKHMSNLVTPTAFSMPQHQGESTLTYTPVTPVTPLTSHSTSMMNGEPLVVSRTSVVLSSPVQMPMPSMAGVLPEQADSSTANSVHNRTARPFAPGCVSHRAATAPVVFRPSPAKKVGSQAQAVSVATMPAPFSPAASEGKKAISTTSLYIPARPATYNGPSSVLSPSSIISGPFSPPPSNAPLYSLNLFQHICPFFSNIFSCNIFEFTFWYSSALLFTPNTGNAAQSSIPQGFCSVSATSTGSGASTAFLSPVHKCPQCPCPSPCPHLCSCNTKCAIFTSPQSFL